MKTGEVLQRSKEAVIDVTRGLRSAIEVKRHGAVEPLEQRQAAYTLLRTKFDQLFTDNPQKVGTLKSDPQTRRMLFEWNQIGSGSLDEKDSVYTFHVASDRYEQKETIWGGRVKERHNELVLSSEGATVTEYEEKRTTPPAEFSEYPFPMVTDSRPKVTILGVQEALDLVEGLGFETFRPCRDRWFADYPKSSES